MYHMEPITSGPVSANIVARMMGGQRVLGRRIRTVRQLRQAVEGGLPVGALEAVVGHVASDRFTAAALKYAIVPKTTLHRRERLTAEESARLERLARMTALAEQVWEDEERAREFLAGAPKQP